MKNILNDPKLTAFALGELEGQEALDMKDLVEQNAEAKKYVEEVQGTARVLTEEFAQEPVVERLTPEQKDKVFAGSSSRSVRRKWMFAFSGLVAAAFACVVLYPLTKEQTEQLAPYEYVVEPVDQSPSDELVGEPYQFEEAESESGGAPEVEAPPAKGASQSGESRKRILEEAFGGAGKTAGYGSGSSAMANSGSANVLHGYQGAGGGGGGSGGVAGSIGHGVAKRMAPGGGGGIGAYGNYNPYRPNHLYRPNFSQDSFKAQKENEYITVANQPLSTFGADVDTASYAVIRKMLIDSQMPPRDAIRTEELVNYFTYDYAPPTDGKPFATHVEVAKNPWNKGSKLVRIGIKGMSVPAKARPASNLVFLVDISGSMSDEDKLPMVKQSLNLLLKSLTEKDRISIVTYADGSAVVLDGARGNEKEKIKAAIASLSTGGGTAGSAGIEGAYQIAQKAFIKGGVNRVLMATDGDFNVGITSHDELEKLIVEKAKGGVFLSILGYGMGNLKDSTMQTLANKGNGNYNYIDSLREARKVLVEQAGGTLQTIAKDVKLQVEFNPAQVSKYRLIGYEKRILANEDFNDDKKDSGEIGAGHTVTAFYEVFPVPGAEGSTVDQLKYQKPAVKTGSDELLTVKIRYKKPEGSESQLLEVPVADSNAGFEKASSDFKFATSVVGFSEKLAGSANKGEVTYDRIIEIAGANLHYKDSQNEYRKEFVELVKKARSLDWNEGR